MLIYKIEYCLPSSLLCQAPIVQLFSISIDAATYAMVGFVTGILLTKYLLWYDAVSYTHLTLPTT